MGMKKVMFFNANALLIVALGLSGASCTESTEVSRLSSAALGVADCPPGTNVILGTAGDDVLVGTSGSDCIIGYGGDDRISGGGGDDFLVGGEGSDTIEGEQGSDEIFGEAGDDVLEGGNGQDTIDGGEGDDIIGGGNGKDTVAGGEGNDVIDGANGQDTLDGGEGNDVIAGANGSDTITGGEGNDTILGGSGGDSIDGGAGNDACDGAGCESTEPDGVCSSDSDCEPGQTCVDTTGVCVYCLDDASCDDGDPLNGAETCVPTEGCQSAGADLVAITIEPGDSSLPLGTSMQFVAIALFSDGSTMDVTDDALWVSGDVIVANVSNAPGTMGQVMGLSLGTALISATLTGVSDSVAVTVTGAELLWLEVVPTEATIAVGESIHYVAIGYYSDGSTVDVTEEAAWASSDAIVADVSNGVGSAGFVTGLSEGMSNITAAFGPVMDTATVTVTGAELIMLEVIPDSATIAVGAYQQYLAIATYSDGTTADVTEEAVWESSDPIIASVSVGAGSSGLVTGLSEGMSNITAAFGYVMDTATVTVVGVELILIEVAPTSATIHVGMEQAFTAIGIYSDGTNVDLTDVATWSSSDAVILEASIAEPGHAMGLSPGVALFSAQYDGVSDQATVEVVDAVLVAIDVFPNPATVAIGESLQLVAVGIFSDGSTMDMTSAVLWTSNNVAVASVSNTAGSEGLATGHIAGIALMSAQYMGFVGNTPLTVGP